MLLTNKLLKKLLQKRVIIKIRVNTHMQGSHRAPKVSNVLEFDFFIRVPSNVLEFDWMFLNLIFTNFHAHN